MMDVGINLELCEDSFKFENFIKLDVESKLKYIFCFVKIVI